MFTPTEIVEERAGYRLHSVRIHNTRPEAEVMISPYRRGSGWRTVIKMRQIKADRVTIRLYVAIVWSKEG